MNRPHAFAPLVVAVALLLACSDEAGGEGDVTELDRCQATRECEPLAVCRDGLCVDAPVCETDTQCSLGESCLEGRCGFDEAACTGDAACLEGEICDEGECRVGCRTPSECGETETCGAAFTCVRRPCTELPCDEGYDCIESSGACQLRPCDGGCGSPLVCREADDTCVECFGNNDCGFAQFCANDGFCANESCSSHDECPTDTFCIDEQCQPPPPCVDDSVEDNDFWPEGTILSEGEHTGFVSCPYDDDFHPFVASGNRALTVAVRFDSADGNLALEVLNTVGVTFGRVDSDTDDESLTLNLFSTGVYAIRIYQPDGGSKGVDYSLEVSTGPPVEVAPDECLEDGFEPNDTQAEATRLFTGRWTGPSICAGDHDYYVLPALAGQLYRACLTPSDLFGVPLGLEVLDGDGTALLQGAGLARFCVEEDLLFGDDYVTHVFGLEPEAEAAYHLELFIEPGCRIFDDVYDQDGLNNRLPRDDDPPLTVIEPEVEHELHVCPANPDYWPVPLLRRDLLDASIDFVHADGDLQMRLLRPSGTVILSSTGVGNNETIAYQAEQDGTHYVRVYGEGGAMGAYTYSYAVTPWCQSDVHEENDTPGAAVPVPEGVTETLYRCAQDDDFYTFVLPADPTPTGLTIELAYPAGAGTLELEVTPPGGLPVGIESAPGSRSVTLESDLVTDAPYLIRVFGADEAQNTYTLSVARETI